VTRVLRVKQRETNNDWAIDMGIQRLVDKGNNKITELRTILQRESQNS
jgi:mannitol/fructose-specific phosphotransferase system IIA component